MNDEYDYLIKIVMIGDPGVGKSSLLLRYDEDKFSKKLISTIGIDFKIRRMIINDLHIKVQIWDTAGQERFRSITTAFYRGAMGILLVYDVTDAESFNNIRMWIDSLYRNAADPIIKILVGNKADEQDKMVISTAMGQKLADEYGIKFYQTSAKNNENVTELFDDTIKTIVENIKDIPVTPKIEIMNVEKTKNECCLN